MKYPLILIALFALFSCGDSEDTETPTKPTEEVKETTDFAMRARKEAMAKLNIPSNEKFDFQVYREEINSDTIEDAIITINRMQFAMDEAIRTGKQAKMAEIGFMGSYNFFIYYDGATDQFSVPLPVPSTPGRPLDVSFENILSDTRKDIVIDYRIRNSGWRSYFSVFDETDLALVFQWKRFDKVGEDKPEALLHQFVTNETSMTKDIYIYESQIDGYNKTIGDMYTYVPSITKAGRLLMRFTFDPRFRKYKLIDEGGNSPMTSTVQNGVKKVK